LGEGRRRVTLNPGKRCRSLKFLCEGATREPGAGGLNVSRTIAIFGGDSLALWTKRGITGELPQQLLEGERLSHQPLPVPGAASG